MSCIENLYPGGRNWNPPGPITPWRSAASRGGNACARGHGRRLHLDPGHLVDEARCGLRAAPRISVLRGRGASIHPGVEPRPSRLHPTPRHGHASTDRDRVDDGPRQPSAFRGHHPACPEKPRSGPRAGSGRSTKDPVHPAARLRSASGRHGRSHPVLRRPNAVPAEALRRDGRSRTGWVPREPRCPWWTGCSRRGDGIAVFSEGTMVARRRGNPRGTDPPDRDPWKQALARRPVHRTNTRRCAAQRPVQRGAESSSGRHDPEPGSAALRRGAGTGTRTRPGERAGG
jgi:hypothetical protein